MKALSKEASTQERKEVPRELSPMLICVLILVFCVTFSFARSGFAQDPTLTELRDVISAPGLETGELFFVVGRSEMAQYFLQSGVLPVSSAVCVNTPAEINNFKTTQMYLTNLQVFRGIETIGGDSITLCAGYFTG